MFARSPPLLLLLVGEFALVGCMDLGEEPWSEAPDVAVAAPSNRPGPGDPGDGGAEDNDGGDDESDGGALEDAPAPCPHPDGKETSGLVVLSSNGFQPKTIEICVGDTVVWENQDTKEHTIVTGVPGSPDGYISSSKFYFGETFSFTFDEPGEWLYYCSTHKKKMRDALVIVR